MKRRYINISGRKIGDRCPVFIIAEAGVNHNGSLRLAMKMVDAAKESGADAIKFQTYRTGDLVTESAPKAAYQKKTVPDKSQFQMLKELELSEADFKALSNYCRRKRILFLSTPFDIKSANYLFRLGMPVFKISSGDLTNIPLLEHIAKYKKPIILSTGMANIQEVREAVKVIYAAGNRKLVLLHCTSNYPTKYEDVNLLAMETMAREFELPVGYSDHTEGIEVAIAAAARGACVIEKHFTLSRKMKGPDHRASIEPEELERLIGAIRSVGLAMGDGVKTPRKVEKNVIGVARKSLVAAVDIPKGSKIDRQMLAIKRPGSGIAPKYYKTVLGKSAIKAIGREKVLTWQDVK